MSEVFSHLAMQFVVLHVNAVATNADCLFVLYFVALHGISLATK